MKPMLQVEHLKSQKEELSRRNSNRQNSETVEVFEELPARIAEMESEIRVLRDQNKRTYLLTLTLYFQSILISTKLAWSVLNTEACCGKNHKRKNTVFSSVPSIDLVFNSAWFNISIAYILACLWMMCVIFNISFSLFR